ncbi:lasso peptide biosynthesis PqqD family chaperone [Ornithinibacillus gellani]|nr:lasso peptide biosynthesis PqqD family chaperone [Ornithinibacillus gellani]
MGGEKVMLSIQNGKYYNLGKMGGEIWGHLKQPISIGKLVYLLMETYQVNQKECETEVVAFLELLLNEQLIEIHKHPKVVDHE